MEPMRHVVCLFTSYLFVGTKLYGLMVAEEQERDRMWIFLVGATHDWSCNVLLGFYLSILQLRLYIHRV